MSRQRCVIPDTGEDREDLLRRMEAFRQADARWREGRVFSLVYQYAPEHTDFLKRAHNLFFSENGLNPTAFRSLLRMERETIEMAADLFHGDEQVAGCVTSGGTESLLLVVLNYRNRARKTRPWIRRPEIVAPESVHVAVMKGCEYFDVRPRLVPCGTDFRADPEAMARAITRNTIGVIVSAPCYPYGTLDPVADIAAIARQRGIPCHVDACLGGFFLPWLPATGRDIPPFDFRVPGVSSLSADLHKYAYAAKGASVLLYRDRAGLRHQVFAEADWCGGAYGGLTLAGTRPGGPIAAAWAALRSIGRKGYIDNAARVMAIADRVRQGVSAIDGLRVLGNPVMGVMAIGSLDPGLSMYAVADQMEQRGWHLDRLQRPEAIHLILNSGHEVVMESWLEDLRHAVETVRAHPELAGEGSAPLYGLMARIPARRVVRSNLQRLLLDLYAPGQEDGPEDAAADPGAELPGIVRAWFRWRARRAAARRRHD
ncbi:MAG TPA: aspartate aminotransferase family protein [Candidatus Hydrogenedentes bacterium]|nr:aspartate aminotransferase family protein [Candidatus Hydrogenedentota bacterium]HOK90319.1 aspartate aminotransferase family protein [Candidatus Hydrogenedentota bacterium]HOV60863.1 aspartate aminotransferase family protein [Candidatus Hydrogenedentota bacterium]